jgi:hypothetical protein
MTRQTGRFIAGVGGLLVAWLALAAFAAASRKPPPEPPFRYAGGKETIGPSCAGNLEFAGESLVFRCPLTTVSIPFSSISLMEYRPDISQRVRKLKLHWTVEPVRERGKENRYFTIVYKDAAATHIVVLRVAPLAMRPYLAELELKSGKRVEVMGYEEYP